MDADSQHVTGALIPNFPSSSRQPFSSHFFPFDPRSRCLFEADAIGPKLVHKKPRAGKALLRPEDFFLPERISHTDNGDLSVSVVGSMDRERIGQVFALAESGEAPPVSFSDLPYAEQQLEKRRYFDHLKRLPTNEVQRLDRHEELAIWQQGGAEAETNFQAWWQCKQSRRQSALLRKANRLANCRLCGRRLDCTNDPDHIFYGEFKCQTRYCRECGADIFSSLFSKYVGLWCAVSQLLPSYGFRSSVVIAKLDFTAANLGRMPMPREIREFNQDVRDCIRRALRELGVSSKEYGFLWCDEFGGWNSTSESYNTNLHAHGVYVGPWIPQQLLASIWTEIRAAKDGAKIVWISKQKIDNPPSGFLDCERLRFVRALGHALKYTGKHVLRSDGARLAQLEVAFHRVRRVHTMGIFYHADLRCQSQCEECGARCELGNGHEGCHHCKFHGGGNRCPLCDGHLMFPSQSGYALVPDLKKEGRRELNEVRRQLGRERIFRMPRGPDG